MRAACVNAKIRVFGTALVCTREGTLHMVLRGKLRDVGLTELFQMLAASSKGGNEGTLTIRSGERKIHIFFGKGRLRLLREGGISHTVLGKLLLRTGKITKAQLEKGLEKQKVSGVLLGRVLLGLGFVTEEDVDNCLKTQLEEEIHNVFLWEDAEFEFTPGPPAAPFVDSALLGKEIPFGVNEFLLEATRRVDEWSKLLEEIKLTRAEFEVAHKGTPPPDPSGIGFSHKDVGHVVDLIGQVRKIDEIVGRAPLSKLEVARVLAFLLRVGYIRRVEEHAPAQPRREARASTITAWRTRVSIDVEDPKLKEQVEKICWSSESKEDAIREISALADSLMSKGKLDVAVPVYQVVLSLEPDDQEVRTKLVHLNVVRWRFADAAKILVEGFRRNMESPSE